MTFTHYTEAVCVCARVRACACVCVFDCNFKSKSVDQCIRSRKGVFLHSAWITLFRGLYSTLTQYRPNSTEYTFKKDGAEKKETYEAYVGMNINILGNTPYIH